MIMVTGKLFFFSPRRRIWQQKWWSQLLGKPWRSWSASLRFCRILAAVPAVSAAVPTVAGAHRPKITNIQNNDSKLAVAAAAVAPAPPTAAPTKCRTSAAAGIVEPVLLRCVAGGHQLCVEHQAGGAGCEERRVVGGQVG